MTDFTKKEIKRSFLKLLEDYPYSEITVKKLIKECAISRSAFYYHFPDLPSVIDEIVQDEINELLRRYPTVESVDQCLDAMMNTILARRRTYLHVYRSVSREMLERHLLSTCGKFASSYVDTALEENTLSPEEKGLIVQHYKCLLFGFIVDWLEEGLKPEKAEEYKRILKLNGSSPAEFVRRVK